MFRTLARRAIVTAVLTSAFWIWFYNFVLSPKPATVARSGQRRDRQARAGAAGGHGGAGHGQVPRAWPSRSTGSSRTSSPTPMTQARAGGPAA